MWNEVDQCWANKRYLLLFGFFLMKCLGNFANVEEWQPCSPKEAFHTADPETSPQNVRSGEWGREGRLR